MEGDSLGVLEEGLHQAVKLNEQCYSINQSQLYIILSKSSPMSQSHLHNPIDSALNQNVSVHLPKDQHLKSVLHTKIDKYIEQLKTIQDNSYKIELLQLRKRLIDKCGLSLDRIDNLESIFLHYCTHIFKTGKHMTFQRLQYEKSHLTMDRFFAFLKDFSLTAALIDGVSRQILDKTEVILVFKKVSLNCKDLNFQQFINCLEKIGILYYDSKTNYNSKQQKLAEDRKRRKENYIKSLKRRKAALEAAKKKANGSGAEDNANCDKATDQQEPNQERDQEMQGGKDEEVKGDGNQNDDLVREIMNDKNLQHPEQQIKNEAEAEGNEVQLDVQGALGTDNPPNQDSILGEVLQNGGYLQQMSQEDLIILTAEQKIQYFYQMINVDNAVSFKKKMRELNLPIFQTKHKRAATHTLHDKKLEGYQIDIYNRQSKLPLSPDPEELKRQQQLKNIFEQRKERNKANSPHMSKEDYEARRKKRKADEQQVIVKRLPKHTKKVQVSELETDLSNLSKMEFDKINFGKFNPQNLYQASEEDDIYLQQYGSVRKPQRSERRMMSNLQANDKNSQLLLEKLKKRTQEIETRQKLEESKYSVAQDVNASAEHQIRKNRLVEKLLKIHRP